MYAAADPGFSARLARMMEIWRDETLAWFAVCRTSVLHDIVRQGGTRTNEHGEVVCLVATIGAVQYAMDLLNTVGPKVVEALGSSGCDGIGLAPKTLNAEVAEVAHG
jgi:hypothetical protein